MKQCALISPILSYTDVSPCWHCSNLSKSNAHSKGINSTVTPPHKKTVYVPLWLDIVQLSRGRVVSKKMKNLHGLLVVHALLLILPQGSCSRTWPGQRWINLQCNGHHFRCCSIHSDSGHRLIKWNWSDLDYILCLWIRSLLSCPIH